MKTSQDAYLQPRPKYHRTWEFLRSPMRKRWKIEPKWLTGQLPANEQPKKEVRVRAPYDKTNLIFFLEEFVEVEHEQNVS